MKAVVLTAEAIRKLTPIGTRKEIADAKASGLYHLVIQPSGVKSWAYRGRVKGEPVKITLGKYPDVDLIAARDLAGDARKAAHAGLKFVPPWRQGVPEPTQRALSAAPTLAEAAPDGTTVKAAWVQYRTLRLEPECKPTTIAEHCRIFEAHIAPKVGSREIGGIVKSDLLPIADAALTRGFEARNKTVAVLTGFFGWCHQERDLIAHSPVVGLKQRQRAAADAGDERALTDAELKTFWRGCEAIDKANLSTVSFGAMFKLLLLTGARRNEVAGMSFDEIDGDVWTVPGKRTKNKKALPVHLTPTAKAIIKNIPRMAGCRYVFGPSGKKCGFGFSVAKERLDEAAKIAPWRLHDLRRTFRTGLGRLGVREEIAERCINHPPTKLVGIYDRHKYEIEMAEAWQKWRDHVLGLVETSA